MLFYKKCSVNDYFRWHIPGSQNVVSASHMLWQYIVVVLRQSNFSDSLKSAYYFKNNWIHRKQTLYWAINVRPRNIATTTFVLCVKMPQWHVFKGISKLWECSSAPIRPAAMQQPKDNRNTCIRLFRTFVERRCSVLTTKTSRISSKSLSLCTLSLSFTPLLLSNVTLFWIQSAQSQETTISKGNKNIWTITTNKHHPRTFGISGISWV